MGARFAVGKWSSSVQPATGFSLFELMIALAVVAILAVVALPSYSAYVIRGKRAEAKVALLQDAQFLERNFSQAGCYGFTDAASCTTPATAPAGSAVALPTSSSATDYLIAPGPGGIGAQAYTLYATPCGLAVCTNGSTFADPACGILTLDNTGAKGALTVSPTLTTATASGTTLASIQQCWQR